MGKSASRPKSDKKHISDKPEASLPTFDEVYKSVVHVLLTGTKEQQNQVWRLLNEGEGDWVWMKMKVITDAYSAADAKGREEFSMIGIQQHLDSGNAKLLKKTFIDPETNIEYRIYKFKNGLLYRIPFATDGMDKYAYNKALNKKFLGDYIEMTSVEETTYIPLDTAEKVKDYNSGGGYYLNHPLYKGVKPIVIKHHKQTQEQSKADLPQR